MPENVGLQIVVSISWAGFFATQGLLWWEFGWKLKDVRPVLVQMTSAMVWAGIARMVSQNAVPYKVASMMSPQSLPFSG